MTISASFLEELRARIPLSDIVGRRLRLQRAGREWRAPCPFHTEKTPSFYVNDQKSFFHCFGCGAHGDAVGFLMRHDGLAFPEAVEQLAASCGLEVPRPEPSERQTYDRLKVLGAALEAAARWFEGELRAPGGRTALDYLRGRGLDETAIAEFRLGYAPPQSDALRRALVALGHGEAELEAVGLIRKPDDGRAAYGFFRNRVIFPVTDLRGRVVAFGGRILEGEGPKYVNSPEHELFHKGGLLYGLARARGGIAKGARPIVVEGYMDVIAMQRAGFAGAVAPLGTALTETQLGLLWKTQVEADADDHPPILCFDGDAAGRRAAERAISRILPMLAPRRTVSVAFLPPGDDPDSAIRRAGAGEVQRVLDGALPLVDAVWEFASAGRSMATPEQRAAFRADLEARAAPIADRAVQSLYRTELLGRFDAAFPRFRGRDRGGARGPVVPLGPRPIRPPSGAELSARILLAAMVNHPFLFSDSIDEFALSEIPEGWQPFRRAVLERLASDALDAQALQGQLRTAGFGTALDALAQTVATHASFARMGATEAEVRAGWQRLLRSVERDAEARELASACADPNRGEDQALRRIFAAAERRAEALDGRLADGDRAAPKTERP